MPIFRAGRSCGSATSVHSRLPPCTERQTARELRRTTSIFNPLACRISLRPTEHSKIHPLKGEHHESHTHRYPVSDEQTRGDVWRTDRHCARERSDLGDHFYCDATGGPERR